MSNSKTFYSSSIHKTSDGRYRVDYSYISPKTNKRTRTCKRGFEKQKDARLWQSTELPKLIAKLEGSEDIQETLLMEDLIDAYMDACALSTRETTCATKRNIIESKITPFFEGKKVFDVKTKDIVEWREYFLRLKKKDGTSYAPTYLRTANNQLSAIFNYAIDKYELPSNPVHNLRKRFGEREAPERDYWTLEEYKQISKCLQDTPMWYYAFEILFWCGIREGELLALTPKNFDLDNCVIYITNTYTRLNGKDIIGETKTAAGLRNFTIPRNLANEIRDYMDSLYGINEDTRIFPMTKKSLYNAMDKACAESGVKRIRIHDIRHSHVSLLRNRVEGIATKSVCKRVGHTDEKMTNHYTHMYDEKDIEIANKLNAMMEEE